MIFYYLPIEIKNIIISYILDDVRLLKIKNNNIIKNILINLNQCISLTN